MHECSIISVVATKDLTLAYGICYGIFSSVEKSIIARSRPAQELYCAAVAANSWNEAAVFSAILSS